MYLLGKCFTESFPVMRVFWDCYLPQAVLIVVDYLGLIAIFFFMLCVCFLVLYAFPSRLLERSFGCHEKERFSSHLIGWELWSIGKPLRIAMYPPHKCTKTHSITHSCTPCFHCPWFIWILKMSQSSQQPLFAVFLSQNQCERLHMSCDGTSD